jgi:hypothetical protein
MTDTDLEVYPEPVDGYKDIGIAEGKSEGKLSRFRIVGNRVLIQSEYGIGKRKELYLGEKLIISTAHANYNEPDVPKCREIIKKFLRGNYQGDLEWKYGNIYLKGEDEKIFLEGHRDYMNQIDNTFEGNFTDIIWYDDESKLVAEVL